MEAFKKYRRSQIAELADWHQGFNMERVSISAADKEAGSPKVGDKIARNPANHADRWLVAADYFAANFEPITVQVTEGWILDAGPVSLQIGDMKMQSASIREALLALRDALPPPPKEPK